MPYPEDLKGKYLDYRVDPGGGMNQGLQALMVNDVLPGQTTPAAVNVYIGQPVPPLGNIHVAPSNPPWPFVFLKYVAGAVTVAPLGGAILTGPMSGCYLCKYTQGGQQFMAHIGTADSPTDQRTIDVKTAWKTFVARNDVSAVTGGSPSDYFSVPEHQDVMYKMQGTVMAGYFTPGAAYAILFAKIPSGMNSLGRDMLRVGIVKPMTLQPWSTISAMRRFRD